MKKLLIFFLNIVIGLVYLYSAYSKLYPIEPFEFTFVDLGLANWQTAPFIARFVIGVEFFLGVLFVLQIKTKWASRISIGMLFAFSIYLIGIILKRGNDGNCGCFRNAIQLTPAMGILKNIVLLLLNLFTLFFPSLIDYSKIQQKFTTDWLRKGFENYLAILVLCIALLLPHILNYVDLDYSEAYLTSPEQQFSLELDSLYSNAKINSPPPQLKSGKHLLAFMSLTCPHCRIAAKKMRIMKERNPTLNFYFILNGDDDKIEPFFKDTGARNISWCMLLGKNFILLSRGTNMPAIYLVNNGKVEARLNYQTLDQSEIENWFKK